IDGTRTVELFAATGSPIHLNRCPYARAREAQRRALAPTFRSDISGWPDAALYPLASAAPRADRHTVGQQTDPLAPAAGRRRRFFFVITLEPARHAADVGGRRRRELRGHRQRPGRHRLARKGSTARS